MTATKIILGARVCTQDGEVGTVNQIEIDPEGRRPGYLIVRRGRILPQEIVVPISLVAAAPEQEILLATTSEALATFPDRRAATRQAITEYDRLAPAGAPPPVKTYLPLAHKGVVTVRQEEGVSGRADVVRGMGVVETVGERVGRVHGLLLAGDGQQMLAFILDRGEAAETLSITRYRMLPADLVANVEGETVHLRIAADHIYGLDVYLPWISGSMVSLKQPMTVVAANGHIVGRAHGFVFTQGGQQVSHLILRRARVRGRPDRKIPIEQVTYVRGTEIHLRTMLDDLPASRPARSRRKFILNR